MPLYNTGYSEAIEAAKREVEIFPTPLDTLASQFRAAFEQDSTFEILHFVPLYFGLAEVTTMLETLESVASGGDPTDFGSNVVANVLQNREQRELLRLFVSTLEQEWDLFYQVHWREQRSARRPWIAAAQRIWDRDLAPALSQWLTSRDLMGGVVLTSESVGPEGRIFSGDPEDNSDNVTAVMLPPDNSGASALSLVRELCFPLVSELVESRGIAAGDRVFAERISSRAAVRCGELLLQQHAPEYAEHYRGVFLSQLGQSGSSRDAFERVFTVDAGLMEALTLSLGGN
jgi:hypothetical protein